MNTYTLTPRDPVVFGDGRPMERARHELWPVPATLSAAINGWLWKKWTPNELASLAGLRGPLLCKADSLYVQPPADALVQAAALSTTCTNPACPVHTVAPPDTRPSPWVCGELKDARFSHRSADRPRLPLALELEERDEQGHKRPQPKHPVSLSDALTWALGQPDDHRPPSEPLHEDEGRIHVGLDSATGTAAEGLLFRTPGVRLGQGVGYAFRWDGDVLPERLVSFGGEGRMAHLERAGELFPGFTGAWRRSYQDAMKAPALLRVELLTPAWFRDSAPMLPSWLDAKSLEGQEPRSGLTLKLMAIQCQRYRAFSGWSWRGDQPVPRPVRRLMPAGSVYWFANPEGRPLEPAELLRAAEALWLSPIDLSELTPQIKPARLGFGLALPGFTPTHRFEVLL